MTDNSAALQRARRREGQTKRRQALAALQAMTEAGEAIGFPAVARRAGVSVSLLYADRNLLARIADARDRQRQAGAERAARLPARSLVTEASLRTDLANAKEQNRHLSEELAVLRDRLARELGADADQRAAQGADPPAAGASRRCSWRAGSIPGPALSRPCPCPRRRPAAGDPSRSAAEAPEWPWSMPVTMICSLLQPNAIARPRRSYCRSVDSVLVQDLLDRGLADIQVGAAAQMRGTDLGGGLGGGVHRGVRPSCTWASGVIGRGRASSRPGCR